MWRRNELSGSSSGYVGGRLEFALLVLALLLVAAATVPAAYGIDPPEAQERGASAGAALMTSSSPTAREGYPPPGSERAGLEPQQRSRPRRMSPLARVYLDYIIRIMEQRSLYRERIDWDDFRARVFFAAGSAQTIWETYPAIEVALFLLEDPHSAYVTRGGVPFFAGVKYCRQGSTEHPKVPSNVGYVKLDRFTGWEGAQEYAESIQQQIREADRYDLAGWIVDLRGNTGGNMWPMIAGIGPILGEGTAGYFTSIRGRETAWGYANGASWILDGREVVKVENPYRLRTPNPRVAILTDNYVMSSGETVLVSFLGRPHTELFGETTCGLSTSRGSFDLIDGARLLLSTYHLADRDRVRYGNSIPPDHPTEDTAEAIQLAIDWLLQAEESNRP